MKSILSFSLLLLLAAQSFGQKTAGTLDPAFGVNGVVTDSFGESNNVLSQLLFTNDGKILAVGDTTYGIVSGTVLKRYLPNGVLDFSFGTHGIAKLDIDTSAYCVGAAIQSDNKIIVVGHSYAHFRYKLFCARVNTDGTLDTSFGTKGKVIIPAATNNLVFSGNKVAIQTDGKIAIAGILSDSLLNSQIMLMRLNINGSADLTINGTGMSIINTDSGSNKISDMILLQSGKICTIGNNLNRLGAKIIVMRANTNGTIDTTFGTKGFIIRDFPYHNNYGYSIVEQSDRKLIAGTLATDTNSSSSLTDYFLLRFNEDGATDNTWGINGIVKTHFYPNNNPCFLDVKSTGKLILGGISYLPIFGSNSLAYTVARFNDNGTFDSTFGFNGYTTIPLPSTAIYVSNRAGGMALDASTKSIYLGGIDSYKYLDIIKIQLEKATAVPFVPEFISSAYFYPNPVTNTGRLHISLSQSSRPYITLYDITGRLVRIISSGDLMQAGEHELNINTAALQSGDYYINIFSGGQTKTLKIVKD